jgi:hypothetical protein
LLDNYEIFERIETVPHSNFFTDMRMVEKIIIKYADNNVRLMYITEVLIVSPKIKKG